MSLTSIRLREAWDWGGLSLKDLALRTYEAMDKHETIDRAAIVAYYAMLALVPYLGLVLTIALGASDRVAGQVENLARTSLPSEDASRIVNPSWSGSATVCPSVVQADRRLFGDSSTRCSGLPVVPSQ